MEPAQELEGGSGRCVVVSDDSALRALLSECACAEGFQVESVATAEAVWDVELAEVEILLVDGQLAGRSGLALCKHTRGRPDGAGLLVFLVAARDTPADIEEALGAGADDYWLSPIPREQLVVRLRVAKARIERRRTRRVREMCFESALSRLPSATAAKLVSLGAVAAGVAHDINNPLAYVLTNLEHAIDQIPQLPFDETGENRARELVDNLKEARLGAERVHRVARDLGLFLRVAEDRRTLVDIHEVLEACVNVAWNEIRHRAELVRDLGAVPIVQAHPSRLSHALLNLLLNAVQAIEEGHAKDHRVYLVTYTNARGEAVIEIADSGPGIPAHVRPYVFEPLFTTRGDEGAAGLGLPIARHIVREHGGTLELDSELGLGTCVRVCLPRTEGRQENKRTVNVPASERTRSRVLVVDDEQTVARALRRVIGPEHEVELVCDARAAIAMICGDGFDLVFCDMMMPDMTGMDLYEFVKRERPGVADRIVFMTGGAFTARAQEFRSRVPNRFIDKPFDAQLVRGLLAESEPPGRAVGS